MLTKLIKFLFQVSGWIFLGLLVVFYIIYAFAPVYKFPEFKPFSGEKIYNPYQDCDSNQWKKANFQVQSKVWWGITDGRNNSNEAIQTVYRQLGYDIIMVSDYMKINPFGRESAKYIPLYEHGYGWRKTHQICLGTKGVAWIDYPVYQNKSHKQHIINILKQKNEVIALAHPQLRDGYLVEDMRYLTNYELIEVLNNRRFSVEYWDEALSYGHLAWIIANDDAHDIFNPEEVGMVFSMINTSSLNGDAVLEALRKGKAYGVDIFMEEGSDLLRKAEDHKNLPSISAVEMRSDTLFVTTSIPFHDVIFFGQNGEKRTLIRDSRTAWYKFRPEDTYIRTEVTFWGSTRFYLNPVFRYSGSVPINQAIVQVDLMRTWIQRFVALVVAIIFVMIVLRIRKKNKKRARTINRYYYYN